MGGVWYYARGPAAPPANEAAPAPPEEWLDNLYSRNPREVEAASEEVAALGAQALPVVQAVLRDHNAEAERIKAALKAAGIIGQSAAPAIPEVAALLLEAGRHVGGSDRAQLHGSRSVPTAAGRAVERRPHRPARVAAIDRQAQGSRPARPRPSSCRF